MPHRPADHTALPPTPESLPPAVAPPIGAESARIRAAVLAWYDRTGRSLPFRGAKDPWAILVSEAMAQQTQAVRAGDAWIAFMRLYPTPAALAEATPAAVLRAWRGLGYNRRALALRSAAVRIVVDHGGRVPDEIDALEGLPGVGPYTARAVAALAFGRPVAAVDTNVRRVVGRLVGAPVAVSPRELQRLADTLVDPDRPGDWTHALMDIGATVCRGTSPDHARCPLVPWCRTAREEMAGRPYDPAVASAGRGPTGTDHVGGRGSRAGEARAGFSSTSRWLRGRLVDRLRDASDGEWVRLEGSLGEHGAPAIEEAVAGLARDGLLERHPDEPALVRLPVVVPSRRAAR